VKISDNASLSLQLFVFIHAPPIFSVLLTFHLKSAAYFFESPCTASMHSKALVSLNVHGS